MVSEATTRPEELDLPWWLVLIEGIALLLLGIFLLVKPAMTSIIVIQFVGIYWFIAGIFRIIGIFMNNHIYVFTVKHIHITRWAIPVKENWNALKSEILEATICRFSV